VLTVPAYLPVDRPDKAARAEVRARAAAMVPAVLERVRRIPGVEVASALAYGLPFSGNSMRRSVTVMGRAGEFGDDDAVDFHSATPDYFKAVRIPLLKGRALTDADGQGAAPVILLSDTAARRYFPDGDALGATVTVDVARTVVGIVGSLRLGGPEAEARPECYIPIAQTPIGGADLVVRTSVDPVSVLPMVKAAIWSLEPTVTIGQTQTLEGFLEPLIAQRRFNMLLISLFGLLAVVIAVVGIYGVMAYLVQQRMQEFGVRIALGAVPVQLLRDVLIRASSYIGLGLVCGFAVALGLARFVEAFLFQGHPYDVTVYVIVALMLLAAGLFAAFVPARRATRVDPLVALRTP